MTNQKLLVRLLSSYKWLTYFKFLSKQLLCLQRHRLLVPFRRLPEKLLFVFTFYISPVQFQKTQMNVIIEPPTGLLSSFWFIVWFLFSSNRIVSILVIKLVCAAHILYCPSSEVSVNYFSLFSFLLMGNVCVAHLRENAALHVQAYTSTVWVVGREGS